MTKIKLKEEKPKGRARVKENGTHVQKIPFHVNTHGFCDLYSQDEITRLLGFDQKTKRFIDKLNFLLASKNSLEFFIFSFLFFAKYFYFLAWGLAFGYVSDFLSEFFYDMDRNLFELLFRILIVCIFGAGFIGLLIACLVAVYILKRITIFAMDLAIAKANRTSRKKSAFMGIEGISSSQHAHNKWRLESDFVLRIERSEDVNNADRQKTSRILSVRLDDQTKKSLEDETNFAFKEAHLLKDLDEISFFDHYETLIHIVKFWQRFEFVAQIILVGFFAVLMLVFVSVIALVVLFDVEKDKLKNVSTIFENFDFEKLDWGTSIAIYVSAISFLMCALVFYDSWTLMRTFFESLIMKKCERVVAKLNKKLKYSADHRFYGLRTESTTNIFGETTRRELVYVLEVFKGEPMPTSMIDAQESRPAKVLSSNIAISKSGNLKLETFEAEIATENPPAFTEPVTYHSYSYNNSYINTKGIAVPMVTEKEKQNRLKNQNLEQDYDGEEEDQYLNNQGFYQRDDSKTPLTPAPGALVPNNNVNDSFFENDGGDLIAAPRSDSFRRNSNISNNYVGYGTTGSTPPLDHNIDGMGYGEVDES